MKDASNIGQDRTIQDPQDAIQRAGGTYQDPVERVSQQQLIDYMPHAPDPNPFTNVRSPKPSGG